MVSNRDVTGPAEGQGVEEKKGFLEAKNKHPYVFFSGILMLVLIVSIIGIANGMFVRVVTWADYKERLLSRYVFPGKGELIDNYKGCIDPGVLNTKNFGGFLVTIVSSPIECKPRNITVDGDPSDWEGIAPINLDSSEDGEFDSLDFKSLYHYSSGDTEYFLIKYNGCLRPTNCPLWEPERDNMTVYKIKIILHPIEKGDERTVTIIASGPYYEYPVRNENGTVSYERVVPDVYAWAALVERTVSPGNPPEKELIYKEKQEEAEKDITGMVSASIDDTKKTIEIGVSRKLIPPGIYHIELPLYDRPIWEKGHIEYISTPFMISIE